MENFYFNSAVKRGNRNNRNSGSLQDLNVDPGDQFGNYYPPNNYGAINQTGRPSSTQGGKKHSKRKQSSVSSRQREGGSLPSDVNIVDQFIHDNRKRSMKYDGKSFGVSSGPQHTVINMECDPEEKQHLLAHDSLAQVSDCFLYFFV